MASRSGALEISPWVAPVVIAIIAAGAIAALVVALMMDGGFGEGGLHPAIFCGILLFVGVAQIVQTRFIVFPAQVKAAKKPETAAEPADIVKTLSILTFAFSVSPAIYGIVVAAFSGDVLYVMPFPVIGLITLGVLSSYVRAQAEELSRVPARW